VGKRLGLGVATLAAGAALLVAAALAGPARSHGIFKLAVVGSGDTMDPQITYNTLTWSLEYATAAKLFNFTDTRHPRLVPEVARSYTVSKNGKTYTFFIRRGFRFSDGTKVTAKNFAYAFKRVESRSLQSPGAYFIGNVASFHAKGRRFIVHLKRPDASLISTLSTPFFQATSKKLPLNREATGPIPSAGPYWVTYNDPQSRTDLRRNQHYRGPRPHHLTGVSVYYTADAETAYQQTLANRFDEGPIPPDQIQSVVSRFHVNRSRFWAKPTSCVSEILLNDKNGLFKANRAMRKAFNWAFDRKAYAGAADPYTQTQWTQLLSPVVPGVITKRSAQPFLPGPNFTKARKLAAGHFKDGRVTVFYRSSGVTPPKQKEVVYRVLRQLGFQQRNIKLVGFSGVDIYDAITKSTRWDIAVSVGFCLDSPYEPESAFTLPGELLPAKYQRQLAAIEKLEGPARSTALGRLALRLMRNVAPEAPASIYKNLYLLSNRVRPRSLIYQRAYQDWDLGAIRLK
jgi:ABC-type transport system substrate-binding protein